MKKKKIAIVLFVLQAISLVGALTSESLSTMFSGGDAVFMIGFFLPTIIGIILLCTANKQQPKS